MIHEQLNWKVVKSGPAPEQIGLGTFTLQLAKDTLVIKGVCREVYLWRLCVSIEAKERNNGFESYTKCTLLTH